LAKEASFTQLSPRADKLHVEIPQTETDLEKHQEVVLEKDEETDWKPFVHVDTGGL
jgi:hypothetical protein